METLYSISEFSKITGIAQSSLRQWHKQGILVPAYISPGNHRYYNHEQVLKISGNNKYIPNQIVANSSATLITGSGTLATEAVRVLKDRCNKLIIYSRDEYKHRKLREKFGSASNIRYIIGDIKDKSKLCSALKNVDTVIHTAAYKMIETGFYSADEVIKVNTIGTMNVAEACIECGVKKALFISSDKACNPLNGLTYGLSKALAESAWLSYNNHSTRDGTIFFATRYGNVINSANSFYDLLEQQKLTGKIKVTHPDMTRFYFTIEEAMNLNMHAIENALGGEIFIPKLKSASVMDFVKAFANDYPVEYIGIRGTEKLAEELIAENEMPVTFQSGNYYKIVPEYIRVPGIGWDANRPKEKPVTPFKYTSDSKDVERLTIDELKRMVKCQ